MHVWLSQTMAPSRIARARSPIAAPIILRLSVRRRANLDVNEVAAMRILNKAAFCAAALILVCAGCSRGGGSAPGARHRWTQPGVLRVAIPQDVKTLNPLLGSSTFDFFVQRL